MFKILICDGLDDSGLAILRAAEGIEIDMPGGLSADQIKEVLPGFDAMIVRSRTKVTSDLIEGATRLKVIGRAGTGVDNIDVEAAAERGILVMNTPGANAMAAAEHTLAMMLSLARHIPQATESMRRGLWEKKKFLGAELYHQTLGILGLGRIGSLVAERALAMKMRVLAFDPHIAPEAAKALGVDYVCLDELLGASDFITLHTSLTDETRRLLNRETLAKTKPGVRIINCARGGLIDEEALFELLSTGHAAGAALDVFEKEPPAGSSLLGMENVIFTPHLGASSRQAQENVSLAIASQILDYLQRGLIRNAVNFPSISLKDYERLKPYLLLAERLGRLQGQLCRPVLEIRVTYGGADLVDVSTQPLTQSVIKGLLDPILAEKVNLINAPVLLKQRQIELTSSTTSQSRGYTGEITVTAVGPGNMKFTATGAVFLGREVRLVRLNDYMLEAGLEGINLIVQNYDKPGTIGHIGTTLGKFNVNIANMHLARSSAEKRALAIIKLDREAPREVLEALLSHPNIISAQQVKL
ncbi:MAG: phosphoglycerate dehydrogenase [Syntrophobacteraceae bacterium]|nr:phosphoglycerate dehydrogenase [Syntrophobacteraceae bacterium]